MRRLLRSSVLVAALLAVASCGSRTGLFGPEPPTPPLDETADVELEDAQADPVVDARIDVRLDAPLDVVKDVIDEPTGCVPGTFAFSLASPQLMFVLDRSGSMDFSLDDNTTAPPGSPSRWTALHDALAQTILPMSGQIAIGARFYPAANADGNDPALACIQDPQAIAIAPALNNAPAILATFDKTSPAGGTPTATALSLAAAQLSSSRAVVRAMVIATDGAPNCNALLDPNTCTCTSPTSGACTSIGPGGMNCLDDVQTIATITSTFGVRKIPVYVIGIGVTTSFAATLDAMAVAGGHPRAGTPKYYAADTSAELAGAFTSIRDSVAKCSYITPSSPDDPDAISVVITGKTIQRDPSHVDGWDWVDREYGHLQLFGPACDQATATNIGGTVACNPDQ